MHPKLVEKVKLLENPYAFAPDAVDWDQELPPEQITEEISNEIIKEKIVPTACSYEY